MRCDQHVLASCGLAPLPCQQQSECHADAEQTGETGHHYRMPHARTEALLIERAANADNTEERFPHDDEAEEGKSHTQQRERRNREMSTDFPSKLMKEPLKKRDDEATRHNGHASCYPGEKGPLIRPVLGSLLTSIALSRKHRFSWCHLPTLLS